jgi:hypothetical protein
MAALRHSTMSMSERYTEDVDPLVRRAVHDLASTLWPSAAAPAWRGA